jgi:hypothetical protein
MDYADIIARLSLVIEGIEYNEIDLSEVHNTLVELLNDVEYSQNDYDDFRFDDLD